METTPENIPDELLIQAKVVCAQLLIKTNTPDIVWGILDIYMVRLEIWTMQAGEYKLLVQLDMEELFSGKTDNFWIPQTKRWCCCKIKTMNRHWYRDIVSSNCWTTRKRPYSVHDYELTTRTEFIWNCTTLKYLKV